MSTEPNSHREQLYSDFIRETAPALADAMQHTLHEPGKLIPMYALLSRIRLSSSSNVIESAERLVQSVLSTYSEPNLTNLTPEEIQGWSDRRGYPLREFSNICRRELDHCGVNSKACHIVVLDVNGL